MSNKDFFIASTIPWFIDQADSIEEQIDNQLQYQLNDQTRVVWRTEGVQNGLVRWDDRHPDEIFQDGFKPRAIPPKDEPIRYGLLDLWRYVQHHDHSVFVSSTRPYLQGTEVVRWQPNPVRRFEYRFYAYGGIDANATLQGNHDYVRQNEITFPGGIRREFIHCARQYDEQQNVIRVWINKTNFNLLANGSHEVPLFRLPDVLNWSVGIQVVNWLAPGKYDYYYKLPADLVMLAEEPSRDPLLETQALGNDDPGSLPTEGNTAVAPTADGDEPMGGPGTDTRDPFLSRTPIRASLNTSSFGTPEQAWFFTDEQFASINVDDTDKLISGPDKISTGWGSLKALGFTTVDAFLPSKGGAWVFSGEKYGRIAINNKLEDSKISGPSDIASYWKALADAGLRRVGAIVTTKTNEAWVFHGRLCARIGFNETSNKLIGGPYVIVDKWASLKNASFDSVDCIVPTSDSDVAWFFKGTRCAKIDIAKDVVKGDVGYTCHVWPSLVSAKFY